MSRPAVGPPWTGHVDRHYGDLDGLFVAGDEVVTLVNSPGWDHLMRLLDAETDAVMATADGRLLASRSEYAFAHGRAGGLRGVRDAAASLIARAEQRMKEQRAKHEGDRDRSPVEV